MMLPLGISGERYIHLVLLLSLGFICHLISFSVLGWHWTLPVGMQWSHSGPGAVEYSCLVHPQCCISQKVTNSINCSALRLKLTYNLEHKMLIYRQLSFMLSIGISPDHFDVIYRFSTTLKTDHLLLI